MAHATFTRTWPTSRSDLSLHTTAHGTEGGHDLRGPNVGTSPAPLGGVSVPDGRPNNPLLTSGAVRIQSTAATITSAIPAQSVTLTDAQLRGLPSVCFGQGDDYKAVVTLTDVTLYGGDWIGLPVSTLTTSLSREPSSTP